MFSKSFLLLVFLLMCNIVSSAQISGSVKRHENFPSKFVDARHLDIWLPPDYDSSKKKRYPVIYMHDGQMLFDGASTWNKLEWMVDEMMTKLIAEKKVNPAIIVGIWNTPKRREEYMPQKAYEMASEAQKKDAAAFGIKQIESDNYLKFLVNELKPFIDKSYRSRPDKKNTFIMGSSMGGLISLYAISEYPGIFGGAGCVSTHFPAGGGVMIDYMKAHLPSPKGIKIYFDYGTETLDASYEPFQKKADEVMKSKGFIEAKNWVTYKFEGDDHSERSWARRLDIPLQFLIGR